MLFPSLVADKIWGNHLYHVLIPDKLTLDRTYLSVFGTYSTGDRDLDKDLENLFTEVKVDIATIADYYSKGITIQIPSRDDMISIHRVIDEYLTEWREHERTDVNFHIPKDIRKMLTNFDSLSKHIYEKLNVSETIYSAFGMKQPSFGIQTDFTKLQKSKSLPEAKPDFKSINDILRGNTRNKRF